MSGGADTKANTQESVRGRGALELGDLRLLEGAPTRLYYLHAWCNPCVFDAAFLDLPRISALLVRRLRGATGLPEAMASGLRSVIAGFS